MQSEFDDYIDQYRPNLDKFLSLSGETSEFFAWYKAKKLAEWLPQRISKKQHILDFGCGDGMMTNFVSKEFAKAKVFGVDPSAKSIEVAQKKYPELSFCVSSDSAYELPFARGIFDIIFAAGVFHHIPFIHHKGYLQELMRILKKNGVIVLFELNPCNPLTVLTFKRNPIDQNARMMTPWYAFQLAQFVGTPELKFYCFFPNSLARLRSFEKYMTKIPLGALYAIIIRAKRGIL